MEWETPNFKFRPKPETSGPIEPAEPAEQTDLFEWLEQDPEIAAASKRLSEEVLKQEALEKANAEKLAKVKALREQQDAIRKQLNELQNTINQLDTDLWDYRVERRETQKRIQAAEHDVQMAKQAREAKKAFERQNTSFVELAKGRAWWEGAGPNKDKILKHQWEGARFLASAKRALLGDSMGLGKTITVLAALDLVQAKKVLILAPADVVSNFHGEVLKWAPHRPAFALNSKSKVERDTFFLMMSMLDEFTILLNYEAWRRDQGVIEALMGLGLDAIILDECHNIKKTSTAAYRGAELISQASNLCPRCELRPMRVKQGWKSAVCDSCSWVGGSHYTDPAEAKELSALDKFFYTRSAKYLWAMTGTPILNKPQDIYAPLSLIDPLSFYNEQSFLRSYCYLDADNRWHFRHGGLESLKKRLAGRFLARTLDDTDIVLPPQKPVVHTIDMDEENYPLQARTIKQLSEYMQIVLESGKKMEAMHTLALITRQRQANVWPGGIRILDPVSKEIVFDVSEEVRESIKMDIAISLIVEAVGNGQRVALFSQFTTALEELQARLNGRTFTTDDGETRTVFSVRFDGSTPPKLKEEIKDNFNKSKGEQPKWDVVLCNYKTGGVGLNLTAATHTIILDEEWNPGKRDQAYARTHRIGQNEITYVHVLRLSKTVDTWLARLIEEKEGLIEGFGEATQDIQQSLLDALRKGELSG